MASKKSPSLPKRAKMLPKESKERLKKKIEERIKQAKEMKIIKKAYLIATQFGKYVEDTTASVVYPEKYHLFQAGDLEIKAFSKNSADIKFKRQLVYSSGWEGRLEAFNPYDEGLTQLNFYYEKALKAREAEMKKKFGLE